MVRSENRFVVIVTENFPVIGVPQNSPSKNILPCRLIGEKWGKLFTNCLFAALGAGLEPFGNTALAHFTQTGTEICLNTFCPATQAVDMLRLDFVRIVPLAPQFRCFCAEFIIIVDGCDSGIAQFAVETAMADQFFCHIVFVFRQRLCIDFGPINGNRTASISRTR